MKQIFIAGTYLSTFCLDRGSSLEDIEFFVFYCINNEVLTKEWRAYLIQNVFENDLEAYNKMINKFLIRLKYNDYRIETTCRVRDYIQSIGI